MHHLASPAPLFRHHHLVWGGQDSQGSHLHPWSFLGYFGRGQFPNSPRVWPSNDRPSVQDGWRSHACGRSTERHGPGPEEGHPEIRAAQAGAGRGHPAHQLVLRVEDVPSDLCGREAHRGQEEAARLWYPESGRGILHQKAEAKMNPQTRTTLCW